jgi:hypothetical protein
MRLGASLAVAAVAALLSCPALAAGEAAGTDTTAPQQQPPRPLRALRFRQAQRHGLQSDLDSRRFPDTSTTAFDPVYMTKLYDLGFQLASTGNNWKKVPPRWVH